MYYNINDTGDEAEIGIMIGDRDYWEKGYGTDAITALVNNVFLRTDIKRVHLKTLDWNQRAQQCFKKCGFKPCGGLNRDGYTFMLMELYRKQWVDQPKESSRFSSEVV
jgi:RimJ/RimL family protein N-acetyltransferase